VTDIKRSTCISIWDEIKGSPSLNVLFVSDGCPWCDMILDNIGLLTVKSPITVFEITPCVIEVLERVNEAACPMLIYFELGEERRRAVGIDEILTFVQE
jgi:hypothetical protein